MLGGSKQNKYSSALAAATFNSNLEKNDPNLHPLGVMLLLPDACGENTISLKKVQSVVTVANSRFPKTVSHVLLRCSEIDELGWLASDFRETFYDDLATLQVGIWISDSEVEHLSSYMKSSAENLGDLISIIFVSKSPTNTQIEKPDEKLIADFTSKLEDINEELEEIGLNKTIEVGFVTEWPDTSESGEVNYLNLLKFWNALSNWASFSQSYIIFKRAFDTPALGYHDLKSTTGWWRLVENSSYLTTSDYLFEEKVNLVEFDQLRKSIPAYTLHNPSKIYNFSNENSIVTFEPYVSVDYGSAEAVDYFPQLNLMSQKFQNILLPDNDEDENTELLRLIATYNTKKPQSKKGVWQPLNVMQLYQISEASVYQSMKSKKHDKQNLYRKISQANYNFPNTVKSILLLPEVLDVNLIADITVSGKVANIKYGIGLDINWCDGPSHGYQFKTNVKPFLNSSLGISYIFLIPTRLNSKLGVDRVFQQVITAVELCKKKMIVSSSGQNSLHVGLLTGWSGKNWEIETFVELVNYWEMLNDWSVRTKTKVIYRGAFDDPDDSTEQYGWWSRVEYPKASSMRELKFIEKKTCKYATHS